MSGGMHPFFGIFDKSRHSRKASQYFVAYLLFLLVPQEPCFFLAYEKLFGRTVYEKLFGHTKTFLDVRKFFFSCVQKFFSFHTSNFFRTSRFSLNLLVCCV